MTTNLESIRRLKNEVLTNKESVRRYIRRYMNSAGYSAKYSGSFVGPSTSVLPSNSAFMATHLKRMRRAPKPL